MRRSKVTGYDARKAYWNVLLGLVDGAKGCTLTATATAADGRWPNDTLPAGTVYPYVDWNVPLTDTGGALLCGTHPFGGELSHAGVSGLYTDGSAIAWTSYFLSSAAANFIAGDLTPSNAGRWADGSYAAACDDYRFPIDGHTYSGATGDGVYTIDPDGGAPIAPFDVYCDMTTAGGGWTLVAQSRPVTDGGLSLCTTGAVGTLDLDAATVTAPAKLSDDALNALWATGPEKWLLAKADLDSTGSVGTYDNVCALDFVAGHTWSSTVGSSSLSALEAAQVQCLQGSVGDGLITGTWNTTVSCGSDYAVAAPTQHHLIFTVDNPTYLALSSNPGCPTANAGRSWLGPGNYGCNLVKTFVRGRTPIRLAGALTSADPGHWDNGDLAVSCLDYRHPSVAYDHLGANRDGVYTIDPDGTVGPIAPLDVYCDMSTDGGGWTLIAQSRPTTNAALTLCDTGAVASLDLDDASLAGPAKLSDDVINAIWLTGAERKVLAKTDLDAWGATATYDRVCELDFKTLYGWSSTVNSTPLSALESIAVKCPLNPLGDGIVDALWSTTLGCSYVYRLNYSPTQYFIFQATTGYPQSGACTASAGRSWLGTGNYGCNLTKTFVR